MPLESFYLLNFKICTVQDHGKGTINSIFIVKRKKERKPKGNPVKTKPKPKIFQRPRSSKRAEKKSARSRWRGAFSVRMGSRDLGHTGTGMNGVSRLKGSQEGPCSPCSPWHSCGVSGRAGTWRCWCCSSRCSASPPRRAAISGSWPRWGRSGSEGSRRSPSASCTPPGWPPLRAQLRVSSCSHPTAPTGTRDTWHQCSQSALVTGKAGLSAVCSQLSCGVTPGTSSACCQSPALEWGFPVAWLPTRLGAHTMR